MTMLLISAALVCLVPIITVIAGHICTRAAEGGIGSIGYRTALSMRDSETWSFANKLAGRVYTRFGIVETVVSVIIIIVVDIITDYGHAVTGACVIEVIQALMLMSPVPYIEKRLREKFNQ